MGNDPRNDFAFSLLQMFDVGHELAYKEYRFELDLRSCYLMRLSR